MYCRIGRAVECVSTLFSLRQFWYTLARIEHAFENSRRPAEPPVAHVNCYRCVHSSTSVAHRPSLLRFVPSKSDVRIACLFTDSAARKHCASAYLIESAKRRKPRPTVFRVRGKLKATCSYVSFPGTGKKSNNKCQKGKTHKTLRDFSCVTASTSKGIFEVFVSFFPKTIVSFRCHITRRLSRLTPLCRRKRRTEHRCLLSIASPLLGGSSATDKRLVLSKVSTTRSPRVSIS